MTKIFSLKLKLKYYALLLALLLLGLRVAVHYPETIESIYTKGFYSGYSKLLETITSLIPFSIGDVLYTIVGILILRKLVLIFKQPSNWQKKSISLLSFTFKVVVVFLVYFNLSWGLNNYRLPLTKQLDIEGNYTQEEVIALTKQLIATTNAQLMTITKDSSKAVVVTKTNNEIFLDVNIGLKEVSKQTQLFEYTPHKVKESLYSLPLTYMGFSGYLNPFTLEAQVNSMVPNTTMIVTASHEVIHQYGYAFESDANFLGYLAALNQDDLEYQYAANVYALRYCFNAIDYNENEPMIIEDLLQSVYPGVVTNIMETTEFWQSYKTITDSFFKVFYSAFLKVNNQKDGIRSYNRFVDLLVNYSKKKP